MPAPHTKGTGGMSKNRYIYNTNNIKIFPNLITSMREEYCNITAIIYYFEIRCMYTTVLIEYSS